AAVEELLHFDARAQTASGFLRSPAADVRAALPRTADAVPAFIGRYRIVRRLGEGGMGTVYEAEQDHPRRTVALKVMRPGHDSPDLRKRFAQEARILGRLHHVGIAQVYDAGVAEAGQLYFALEFIRGLPLNEHARLRSLTLPARLELMARVCDAVQHAHEQGVIHRDLKPANVLVEDTGQPKVLDFGVAHATGAGLLSSTVHTRSGQLIGTLGYMSPEQVAADAQAIDARSDVYALGVRLYELLADRLRYQLDALPTPDVGRGGGPVAGGVGEPAVPRREREDRGQGPGEGQDPALPDSGRSGGGPAPLPGAQADPGAAGVGTVQSPEVRGPPQGAGGRDCGRLRGAARRHDHLSGLRPRRTPERPAGPGAGVPGADGGGDLRPVQ